MCSHFFPSFALTRARLIPVPVELWQILSVQFQELIAKLN